MKGIRLYTDNQVTVHAIRDNLRDVLGHLVVRQQPDYLPSPQDAHVNELLEYVHAPRPFDAPLLPPAGFRGAAAHVLIRCIAGSAACAINSLVRGSSTEFIT
jgi:hypothetical protein